MTSEYNPDFTVKRFLLFIFIISAALSPALAQKKNKKTIQHDSTAYYMRDENSMANNEQDARFLRLIIKKDSVRFEIQDYWMDGKLRLVATSLSNAMLFEPDAHGAYIAYYPNGNKRFTRQYDHGKIVGNADEYYPNGVLKYSVIKNTDYIYLQKYQDSTGKVLADNGNGFWRKYDDPLQGQVLEGDITNGRENGRWKLSIGDSSYFIGYDHGKIVSGEADLRHGPETFKNVEVQPAFPGDVINFTKFLASNVKYPAEARNRNVTGKVTLSFTVEKDGSLSNIRVTDSPDDSLSQEALRVIRLSPKWKPGIQNENPVRVKYTIPVTFGLAR